MTAKSLAVAVWGSEELRPRSERGRAGNFAKKGAKKCLTPQKLLAIKGKTCLKGDNDLFSFLI